MKLLRVFYLGLANGSKSIVKVSASAVLHYFVSMCESWAHITLHAFQNELIYLCTRRMFFHCNHSL